MTPVAIATQDQLSEAIALRLLADVQAPHYITHTLRKGGFGYLHSKMDSWYQMAQHQVMVVLTDLVVPKPRSRTLTQSGACT